MAAEFQSAKVIVSIETLLKNLDRDTKRLEGFKKLLLSIASIKTPTGKAASSLSFDKASQAALKLLLQQQRLAAQTQELANRQERARQATERLAQAQARLNQVQTRAARTAVRPQLGAQQDAQVRAFRAIEAERIRVQRRTDAETRRQQQAADSLQRQRSGALIQQLREQERAAARTANAFRDRFLTLGSVFTQVGQSVASFGTALSIALTAPLTAIGILATRNAVTLDSLTRGLTAIVGSAQEAGIQLARLTEIAKLPGIGFQEAIQGSVRLQAVGFSAEVAERALRQFANAVALTGGGREELSRITVQLGQLSAKGKVLAQDLKPIIEAGPAVGRALLQAFGTVNSEDIQALGLTSAQFIDQLLTALEKLPRAAAGARNTFDNFSDAVFRASSAIGTAILPVLTRLVETFEPLVTRLAQGFASLSPVVQTTIVVFGGLVAAIGPFTFIAGQLITSVGSLVTAFARLAVLGLTPTIQGFQLLTQVMRGSASLVAGQAATTAAAAGGWIALAGAVGAAVAVIAVVGVAIAAYSKSQKEAVKISVEQIAATKAQIDSLRSHIKFLDGLTDGVKRTADEQERLSDIYASLNTQAKIRLTGITDEEKRLAGLREELNKILQLRNAERVQQAANLAASLANTAAEIAANQKSRDSVAGRVASNTQLSESISKSGRVTLEHTKQLQQQGITSADTASAIFNLNKANERLIDTQSELIKASEKLNGTAEEQGQALRILGQQTGLSARELLSAAKAMGLFKGNIETALPAIERFIEGQERAAKSTATFTEVLKQQNAELLKAGQSADDAAKQRNDIIKAAASLAREASDSFEGALKFMRAFITANPDLRQAIEKERQLAGKSFEEFIEDALGGRPGAKDGKALRNAREQLTEALTAVALAQKDREVAIEQDKNDELLRAAEVGQRLRLLSYREFLELRANLTADSLDKEINQQQEIVKAARAAQFRLLAEAKRPGLEADERARRQAQAAQAEEEAIKAETRLIVLQRQRGRITTELQQTLSEAQQQQIADIAQLEIRYAELQGRIEDALKAATVEEFREQLETLGKAQKFLNEQVNKATGERKKQLEVERQLNQRQIESVQSQIRARDALAQLAAAEKLVENAKERQRQLEADLAFQVAFRGLAEEEAIRRRLEGEQRLQRSLELSREIIADTVKRLTDLGITPPPQLQQFLDSVAQEIIGLRELPFAEQFRLAEKEFNRLNDERIRRIQDVERAVRNRTIAEIEGQILIRRINGEYTADLQQQLEILRRIAEASGQEGLRRQADDAGEVVKDTRDGIRDLSAEIESAGKDAFRSGLSDFFKSLGDRSIEAKDKILNFIDSIVQRVNDVIADQLSEALFESIFGVPNDAGSGLIASVKRLFGFGGEQEELSGGDLGAQLLESQTAQAALTTGATVAATTLTTGAVTASTTLATTLATAAAAFAAQIAAAGASFAAAVAAASATQSASGIASLGSAATGLFPAIPGGAYRFVEGGYPEAVITTDPQHAARQVQIIREVIERTRGFYGRLRAPDLAMGGIVSRETAEANLLSSINRAPVFSPSLPTSALETANGASLMNLRIVNQVDSRSLARPYVTSEEGTRDLLNFISTNSNEIARRLPIRGR